jgi:ribosome biogenesis GTPase / thiamine phosphate phosphatase
MPSGRPGRKSRVGFRPNRQARRRSDEWTQKYRANGNDVQDTQRSESVRAKGDLSRKRTIFVDENELPVIDESQWLAGMVTRVHGLLLTVRDDQSHCWECTIRRVMRTRLIERRAPVCVGDRVWISDQSRRCGGHFIAVIERVVERKSWLSRRDARRREHAIAANADQLLAVVSIAQPRLRPHLLDRYIVAAFKGGVQPLLCFHKLDLLGEDSVTDTEDERQPRAHVRDVIEEFRTLGYPCVCTSIVDGRGIDELRGLLKDRLTVIAGQSGVGKSSLINAIEPSLTLRTCEVSAENEKGKHTTTLAELLPLGFGGFVVDTPGIRAFDLWGVQPGELEACFVEFLPLISECRFANCTHRHEEGCAVQAAVEAGRISERRYYSYLKLFEDV